MISDKQTLIKKAKEGDINSFQILFSEFHQQLKSYLYRLLADRNDAEDITHDTFIRAFDKIKNFSENSSFKTWTFTIATHLAYDFLRKRKRWSVDAQDLAREFARNDEETKKEFRFVSENSTYGNYEIKEHIDFCFTCIGKTLLPEQQVSILLKEIYDFSVKEIADTLMVTEGVVKHLLVDSRKTMTEIFDKKCALINKNGTCHQCSELNSFFNPKQNQHAVLMELELVKNSKHFDREQLFELRAQLIKAIDPLRSGGNELQEAIMKCTRKAIGEIN